MNRSEETPIPKDQLLDERETHQEFQKSKKKVLHKDNWRTDRKRFSEQSEEFWKGKTIYKIKEDYVIPDDIVRSDIDRAKLNPFVETLMNFFTLSQPLQCHQVYRRRSHAPHRRR